MSYPIYNSDNNSYNQNNIQVNSNSNSLKTCLNNHTLSYEKEFTLQINSCCFCNSCKGVIMNNFYSCLPCKYYLCPNCYGKANQDTNPGSPNFYKAKINEQSTNNNFNTLYSNTFNSNTALYNNAYTPTTNQINYNNYGYNNYECNNNSNTDIGNQNQVNNNNNLNLNINNNVNSHEGKDKTFMKHTIYFIDSTKSQYIMTIPPVCTFNHPITFVMKTEKEVYCFDCKAQVIYKVSYVCELCKYYLCFDCTKRKFGVRISGQDNEAKSITKKTIENTQTNYNNSNPQDMQSMPYGTGDSKTPSYTTYELKPEQNNLPSEDDLYQNIYKSSFTQNNVNKLSTTACYVHDFYSTTLQTNTSQSCSYCKSSLSNGNNINFDVYCCTKCVWISCIYCHNKTDGNDNDKKKSLNSMNKMTNFYGNGKCIKLLDRKQ